MKKPIKAIALLVAAAITVLAAAMPAFADYNFHIGVLTVNNGEQTYKLTAIGIARSGGGAVIYSNYQPTGSESDIQFKVESGTYPCSVSENGNILADMPNNDPALSSPSLPDEGMKTTMEYHHAQGFTNTVVTITNLHFEENVLMMTVEGFPGDIDAAPAFLFDKNNCAVAIVKSDGTAYTPWAKKVEDSGGGNEGGGNNGGGNEGGGNNGGGGNSGGGNADGNSSTLMVIALAAAVVLTVVFLMKNRSPQQPANSGLDQAPDGGGFNDEFSPRPGGGGATMPVMPVTPITPAQESAAYRLRGVGGPMDGRVYSMNGGELTIGRSPESVILYGDGVKGVSRRHCKLFIQGGSLMLMDTGSSYGTFLDGKGRLTPDAPQPVKRGDSFCVGDTRNKFVIE